MLRGLAHINDWRSQWPLASQAPPLLAGRVLIWKADLNISAGQYHSYYSTLSKDEKERASRFRFEEDRIHFVAARGILRQVLAQYLDCSASEIIFEYNAYGKPHLPAGHDIEFNLSHSGGVALLAFSVNQAIGVDLEVINPTIEIAKLAQRFFSKNEADTLLKQPEEKQARLFFNCWTRKEAFIKGHGEGLSLALDQFEVSLLDSEVPKLKATRWDMDEAKEWELYSLKPDIKKTAAVAIKGEVKEIQLLTYHSKLQYNS